MRLPYFILLNFLGVLFSIEALLLIAYFLFGFQIHFPDAVQKTITLFEILLFAAAPIISFVFVYWDKKNKHSKILGFTYLTLWICVLVRMLIFIC
jgi:membrane protein DedA with SNARE-associated domain